MDEPYQFWLQIKCKSWSITDSMSVWSMCPHTGEISIFFTQPSEHTELRGYFPPAHFLIGNVREEAVFPSTLLTHKPVPFLGEELSSSPVGSSQHKKITPEANKKEARGVPLIHPTAQGHSWGRRALLKGVLKKLHHNLAQPIILALYSLLDYTTKIFKFLMLRVISPIHTYGLPYINSLGCYLHRKKQSSGHTILHTLPVTRAETR